MAKYYEIDYGKCIGCHRCIEDCVTKYLVAEPDSCSSIYQKPVPEARSRCIGCGHCYAICPVGALYQPDNSEKEVYDDKILELMLSKRSVRKYKSNSRISTECLDKIILAGQTAPTEKNRKNVRIIFIKEKLQDIYHHALDYLVEEVKKTGAINPMYAPIMEYDAHRDEILWNAEYLVAIVGSSSFTVDAAITAERMQLEAANLGIGSSYRGDMKLAVNGSAIVRDIMKLKSNEEALVTFTLGHTDIKYRRGVMNRIKKVEFI